VSTSAAAANPTGRGAARGKTLGVALFAAALIAFPFVITNPTYTSIGVFSVIFMACATGWNAFSGYSGYISLGHGVFFGTGAYTIALLANHLGVAGGYGVFALVPVAGLIAALVAVPFGLVALRTRRRTFIVITIAIFWLFQLSAYNLGFTGGAAGLQLPTPLWTGSFFNLPFYFASLIVFVIAVALSWVIRRSRFGLQLLAIRDDEDRAQGLGVKVWPVKVSAFTISAFVTGMGGALWAYFIGQIFPQFAYDPIFDVSVALMTFFGGLGTLVGPVFGALVLESAQQYLTLQFSNGSLYLVVFGCLFLAVLLLIPKGIIPGVATWTASRRERARVRGEQPPDANADASQQVLVRPGSGR
jgi:branched-chain amino acid transport system permease protein